MNQSHAAWAFSFLQRDPGAMDDERDGDAREGEGEEATEEMEEKLFLLRLDHLLRGRLLRHCCLLNLLGRLLNLHDLLLVLLLLLRQILLRLIDALTSGGERRKEEERKEKKQDRNSKNQMMHDEEE